MKISPPVPPKRNGPADKKTMDKEERVHACSQYLLAGKENDQVLQGFSVDKGEFTCPLCRQFANSVLPCYPGRGVEKAPSQTPSNKNVSVLVKEVEDLQEQLGTFSSETNLSREMESVIKDIKNTTQKKYMDYSKNPGSPDNDFLFMYSVARTNLELELVHRGGDLCCGGASAFAKRSCLNQLFHVLAMHMRLYSIDSAYNPWTRLTQLTQKRDSHVCNDERPEVPLLFRDVPSLLIIFVLTMPQPLHKEHFTCIVKVLYTLQYIHAIAALSVKFSAEERLAWKNSGALKKHTSDAEKSWEVLLSHGISELSKGNRFYEVATEEISMISSSIWSPQSIEYALQQFCLPFLRISSLLQHHLFGDDLPSCLHSQHCGAATGIFLLINASVIIIIRGHRFCLWGAVYLDAHGEEDRDLRRGKPLYLCEERYKVLEQQWVSHTFDHINKRWGPHYNGL
ncbi:UNVERIFIED_CONTAM: hypothetical protein FKN15_021349 [Acipenser sinensis]